MYSGSGFWPRNVLSALRKSLLVNTSLLAGNGWLAESFTSASFQSLPNQSANAAAAAGCLDCAVTAVPDPPQTPLDGSDASQLGSVATFQSPAAFGMDAASVDPPHAPVSQVA